MFRRSQAVRVDTNVGIICTDGVIHLLRRQWRRQTRSFCLRVRVYVHIPHARVVRTAFVSSRANLIIVSVGLPAPPPYRRLHGLTKIEIRKFCPTSSTHAPVGCNAFRHLFTSRVVQYVSGVDIFFTSSNHRASFHSPYIRRGSKRLSGRNSAEPASRPTLSSPATSFELQTFEWINSSIRGDFFRTNHTSGLS